MPVAVTALDVALVGGIAAVVSAVVAPFSAWVIARQTQRAETERARENRVYTDRMQVYEETLKLVRLVYVGAIWIESAVTGRQREGTDMPTLPRADELTNLYARLDVIGSPQMAAEMERLMPLVRQIGDLSRNLAHSGTITEAIVAEAIAIRLVLRERLDRMADLARRELGHDRAPVSNRRRSRGIAMPIKDPMIDPAVDAAKKRVAAAAKQAEAANSESPPIEPTSDG
jgi:hypothetical protein